MHEPVLPSPITDTLSRVLQNSLRRLPICSNRRIETISYTREFEGLWGLRSDNLAERLGPQDTLVVVDDWQYGSCDLPEAGRYLTPLDWAVWSSLNNPIRTIPAMVIVQTHTADSFARPDNAGKFFAMFLDREISWLPNIRFFSAIEKESGPNLVHRILRYVTESHDEYSKGQLLLIKQIWQSFFLRPTQPSENHSLANILGAGWLTGDFGTSSAKRALSKFMRTLDLLPRESTSVPQQESSPIFKAIQAIRSCLNLKGGIRGELQFVLVDDDSQLHGWSNFVANSLGLSEIDLPDGISKGKIGSIPARLKATDDARDLLKWLRIAIDNKKPIEAETGKPCDVIYLDLRLFERASLADEAKFFLEIIALTRQARVAYASRPGDWPRVSEDELEQTEAWCELAISSKTAASRNDALYIDALTLLPRLIAGIDPSLPIVLFSSTQRRRVTEAFRKFDGINSRFSKPSLQLGQTADSASRTLRSFEIATAEALEFVRARRLCRTLAEREISVFWRGHVERPIEDEAGDPWNVQLFVDESERDKKMTVGGFLAIYPPGACPEMLNQRIYSAHPEIRLGKNNNRKGNLASVLLDTIHLLEEHEALVIPLSLTGERQLTKTAHSSWEESDIFRDELVADNLHRELIKCLIEVGLFVFARQVLPDNCKVAFSFFAPSRVLPATSSEAELLNATWGLQVIRDQRGRPVRSNKGVLVAHLDRGSARPILDEVFRLYEDASFEPTALLARSFGLSDNAHTNEKQRVRALHYLADGWLYDHKDTALDQVNSIAVTGSYGVRLVELLVAHRYLLRGNIANAVLVGAKAASKLEASSCSVVENSILVALQDAARRMTGQEYSQLAAIPCKSATTRERVVLRGKVTSVSSSGKIMIRGCEGVFSANVSRKAINLKVGDLVQFEPRRSNRLDRYIAYSIKKVNSKQ